MSKRDDKIAGLMNQYPEKTREEIEQLIDRDKFDNLMNLYGPDVSKELKKQQAKVKQAAKPPAKKSSKPATKKNSKAQGPTKSDNAANG